MPIEVPQRHSRGSVELGLPGDTIHPRVLGPPELPRVMDPAEVRRRPEIAVLSAMAHGNEPGGLAVVMAVLNGLVGFDEWRGWTVSSSTTRLKRRFEGRWIR